MAQFNTGSKYAYTYNSPSHEPVGETVVFDTKGEADAYGSDKCEELIAGMMAAGAVDDVSTFDRNEAGWLTIIDGSIGGNALEHWLQVTPVRGV